LSHIVGGKAKTAYDHAVLLERMTLAKNDWQRFCDGEISATAKIIDIKYRAA